MSTLVYDRFRAIPPTSRLYWFWDSVNLSAEHRELLFELARRITYFGRAESFCQIRLLDELPDDAAPNCTLIEERSKSSNPVLVPNPKEQLDLDSLLAATDAKGISGMTAPPSATWYYAHVPEQPKLSRPKQHKKRNPNRHTRNPICRWRASIPNGSRLGPSDFMVSWPSPKESRTTIRCEYV